MDGFTVRLLKVTIDNFKNINHGEIVFNCAKDDDAFSEVDILGIYGQNGSGKTSFIQSLEVLKYLLMGMSLPPGFAGFLNSEEEACHLKYHLIAKKGDYFCFYITYSVSMTKLVSSSNGLDATGNLNTLYTNINLSNQRIIIKNERITFKNLLDEKSVAQELINCNYNASVVFSPATKVQTFTNADKMELVNLLAAKKIAQEKSQSFIFSGLTLGSFRKNCTNSVFIDLLNSLVNYGNFDLFIVGTMQTGFISFNARFPLYYRYINENSIPSFGIFYINADGPTFVSETIFQILEKILPKMNIVLDAIIPGLTIKVSELGKQLFPDNSLGYNIELVAIKNNKEIPLKNESEGIRRIYSILHLLINMFNSPSMTIVIDELDSCIFEYLLGELTSIIAESGKGQLVFTSHNLRPLETIDKRYLYFTTTNPDNRFIKLKHIKPNNNLRDVYFRDITLGGQDEQIYDETNNISISLAFKQAGDYYGK